MQLIALVLIFFFTASTSVARLGDTQDRAEARYGLPKKRTPTASTLLPGALELSFEFEGWRIRCALLPANDGKEYVVKEEYSKLWNSTVMKAGGTFKIRDFEREAVLQAEKGTGTWRAKVFTDARDGAPAIVGNQFADSIGIRGKFWVREDGAIAHAPLGDIQIVLELPQARKYESELKAIKEQKARSSVPKF